MRRYDRKDYSYQRFMTDERRCVRVYDYENELREAVELLKTTVDFTRPSTTLLGLAPLRHRRQLHGLVELGWCLRGQCRDGIMRLAFPEEGSGLTAEADLRRIPDRCHRSGSSGLITGDEGRNAQAG